MIFLLSSIGIIIQGYMYLYPDAYISELLFSFLPYTLVINIVICIISLYQLIQSNSIYKKIVRSAISICCGAFLWLQIQSYHSSYYDTSTSVIENRNPVGISFFYTNIYYQNKNLSGLIDIIQRDNPDIILLVEYTREQNEILSSLLKSTHPYVSRYIGGQGYDGDVIYSRYPLEKIKHTVYPGSFSHISVTYKSKQVDFALIHTSAPVSPQFFEMRNRQLNDLSILLSDYYKTSQTDKNIILLGDFNITPWSAYYTDLDLSMKTLGLYNITNNTKKTDFNTLIPYTRCHKDANIFCAHIDHIWSNISIQSKMVKVLGSDHYGFIGKF